MESIASSCSELQRSVNIGRAPEHSRCHTPGLHRLPPELISIIFRYLPLSSAAAYCLTCRYSYDTLEEEYLRPLKRTEHEDTRYDFQVLLAKEMPDQIACHSCMCFHRISTIEESRNSLLKAIRNDFWQDIHCKAILFHMMMKRYRQGQDLTGLLSSGSLFPTINLPRHYLVWDRVCIRAYENNLLVRRQTMFMLLDLASYERGRGKVWDVRICRHYSVFVTSKLCDSTLQRDKELIQCPYCYTEFRIDCKMRDDKVAVVFVTAWHNFGPCESRIDEYWQTHNSWLLLKYVEFEPGSIRSAFEKGQGSQFDELIREIERDGTVKIGEGLALENDPGEVAGAYSWILKNIAVVKMWRLSFQL